MAEITAGNMNVRQDVRRVLVYRMGSLGDTVVALPALHLIAKAFPNADRRMLTNFPVSSKAPAAKAILAENGLVHGYFRYVVGTRSVKELVVLWWTLVRWRPEVLVYLGPRRGIDAAKRDARFFRLCGIGWQVGVPVTKELQDWARVKGTGSLEPEAERLVRNIRELGDAAIDSKQAWDLRLTADEHARAADVFEAAHSRPVITISMGTKVQSNDWGKENWRALLQRVGAAFPDYALVITGVKEEREVTEWAAEGWRAGAAAHACVVNLCGVLTPRETAAVFAGAKVFVGHDSGPMHLAAAVGTPCVAIFSARNPPGVWFPHGDHHQVIYHEVDCMGCGLETCIEQQKKCLTSVTVEEVYRAVAEALTFA